VGSGGRRSRTCPCPGPRPPSPLPVPSARPYSGLRQAGSRCRLARRHLTPHTSDLAAPCPRRASSPVPSRRMMDGGACCCVVTRPARRGASASSRGMVLWGTRLRQHHSRAQHNMEHGGTGRRWQPGGQGAAVCTVHRWTGAPGRTVLVGWWWWLAWCRGCGRQDHHTYPCLSSFTIHQMQEQNVTQMDIRIISAYSAAHACC
jgi:hypothetical protein